MPFDRSRYPADWDTIRADILKRADNKCEKCRVPNRVLGYRESNGDFVQLAISKEDAKSGCGFLATQNALRKGHKIIEIVLTIAHVGPTKHDKMDCRPEVLLALCQRCHLREDIEEHTRNAATTRFNKRAGEGQITLIEI